MARENEGNEETFVRALRNREDISDNYHSSFGWDKDEAEKMLKYDYEVRRRIRNVMEESSYGIQLLSDVAAPHMNIAHELLDGGRVGAVDGTNALSKTDYMNTTKFSCAVSWLTSRKRGSPCVNITRTTSSYVQPNAIAEMSNKNLEELGEVMDKAREDQSWPTAFREYCERETALYSCEADYIFIDGPIFTQNLMTQSEGRKLYDKMMLSEKEYIGVIKNISGSNTATRWSAAALEPGEMHVVGPVYRPILKRIANKWPALGNWITQDLVKSFQRVVFRPRQKAFAFECREDNLSITCALLLADASKTLNHEIPFLLETVDVHVRKNFNGNKAREINIDRMIRGIQSDDHMQDYRDHLDVIDEREWR